MRRAALWLAIHAAAGAAYADPTTVTAEGGAEADTNVRRVETGPGMPVARVAAPLVRFGAKLDHRGRLFGGAYAATVSALSRVVIQDPSSASADNTERENQVLFAGDLRWLRPLGERPVSAGFGVVAIDQEPLLREELARRFRTLGADALLVLRGSDDRALSVAFGWRDFIYKPEDQPSDYHDLDWNGPTASARLDLTLWQDPGGTRSLELALTAGFEARAYDDDALASACPGDAPPDPMCYAGTSFKRRDRYQRAGMELMWTGGIIAAVGYQLHTIDSNSYGQSLVRHRLTVSGTMRIGWGIAGTVIGTLQIDQYLDGFPIETDTSSTQFTTLDDENRSSLQLRLGRQLSKSWELESRAAIWRNLGGNLDTSFRRALFYAGAVFRR